MVYFVIHSVVVLSNLQRSKASSCFYISTLVYHQIVYAIHNMHEFPSNFLHITRRRPPHHHRHHLPRCI